MATNGSATTETKQAKAIAALLAAKDGATAAQQAGVSETTLYRWLREDKGFQEALRGAEKVAIDEAVRRLAGAAGHALNTILVLMLDRDTPASIRLRAATVVLEQLVKLRELTSLEERIAALEEALERE
jgi:transposase-like protein